MKIETFDNKSPLFQIFRVFWNLQKKYFNGDANHERGDAYWEELLREAALFPKKYDESYHDFIHALLWAFLDEIERRGKAENTEVEYVQ